MRVEARVRYVAVMHPFQEEDLHYIRGAFIDLDVLCQRTGRAPARVFAWIAHRRLPSPVYALPDGTAWVWPGYFDLLDEAGAPEALRALFDRRYRAEAERHGETPTDAQVESNWQGYLDGGFGACLREVTPETVFRKERWVRVLTAQLSAPAPEDPRWAEALREGVAALDALERPFAPYDRLRFGGPVSRDRLIVAPRARYPEIFGGCS